MACIVELSTAPIELLKSKEDMGYLLYPGKPENYLEGIFVMNYVDYAKI